MSQPAADQPPVVAAVDLGSNSFHMIVAQPLDGELRIIDRLREPVRLASGLDADNQLAEDARQRALACLSRFGQRLAGMPSGSVRAVGTNTLRKAKGTDDLLTRAAEALGHPIEVIAGREEARLIYLGVSHSRPALDGRQLVMDIGGGSTEFIIGERFEPLLMESLFMGCVSMTQAYFADGTLSEKAMKRAEIAAGVELQPIKRPFRQLGWQVAAGASGTIRAIGEVVRQMGWSEGTITRDALVRLRRTVVELGHVNKLSTLKGLREERAPVFAGGLAVLQAAFNALEIEEMAVADWALREGLIYDLIGRINHEDVRERTILGICQRYGTDVEQAQRIDGTAQTLLHQLAPAWGMVGEECASQLLHWAARLHEIGLVVAHNQYHKHAAYLIENADLPGFSRQEQHLLALLVRVHRRKFADPLFKDLPKGQSERAVRLAVVLRLAVLLHRSRSEQPLPAIGVEASNGHLSLKFPPGWLDQHPLTQADLSQEAEYLTAAKVGLSFE